MKHNLPITLLLVLLFLATQLIGLVTLSRYIDIRVSAATGKTVIYEDKYIIAPPQVEESSSWLYIAIAIFLGTGLALLIVKFNKVLIWRVWFFLSVFITLALGLFPYVEYIANAIVASGFQVIAGITIALALLLAVWKLFYPNVFIYNITEVFIYSGIAALLVPILNMISIVILLLIISLYDFWAVYKTKHMVKLAKFQSASKMFAGLLVPYKPKKGVKAKGATVKHAILGGGDIAFPLLFAGVVLKTTGSFMHAFTVSIFAGLALFALFAMAQKDKYYPAMPVISTGCIMGYLVTLLF